MIRKAMGETMATDSNLRKLQLTELALMQDFDRMCKKHGLRYYLLGGTLLGAVRHGGFIPWDDDVDLCMPRDDYMRFLELAPAELAGKPGIGLVSVYSDETYRQGMAKITDSSVRVINRSANEERHEEAWIDIIPMDGFPVGVAAAMQKIRLMFWRVMDCTAEFDYVIDTKRDRGFAGNLAVKAIGLFSKVVRPYGDDFHRVLIKTENCLRRYAYDESPRTINLHAARGFREIFDREWLGEGKPVMFEGIEFVAPANIEAVLTAIYGPDYMTPPPEGERNWHNSEIIVPENAQGEALASASPATSENL